LEILRYSVQLPKKQKIFDHLGKEDTECFKNEKTSKNAIPLKDIIENVG
jgi:hypothetical protein